MLKWLSNLFKKEEIKKVAPSFSRKDNGDGRNKVEDLNKSSKEEKDIKDAKVKENDNKDNSKDEEDDDENNLEEDNDEDKDNNKTTDNNGKVSFGFG